MVVFLDEAILGSINSLATLSTFKIKHRKGQQARIQCTVARLSSVSVEILLASLRRSVPGHGASKTKTQTKALTNESNGVGSVPQKHRESARTRSTVGGYIRSNRLRCDSYHARYMYGGPKSQALLEAFVLKLLNENAGGSDMWNKKLSELTATCNLTAE